MNRSLLRITTLLGILLSVAGLVHGIYECLQGNHPTGGLIIQAIGDAQQNWQYGTEEAFTLMPTFLSAGVASILVSMSLLVWSLFFLAKKQGATVFLLLCVLLFLVGGGIAQLVFFLPGWGAATRINRRLKPWKLAGFAKFIAPFWPVLAGVGMVSFFIGLIISVTGFVPGVAAGEAERILNICWSFIFGGGWIGFFLAYVSGFAKDSITNVKILENK